jgi:prephenate dehydrogenase
MQLLVIGVGLVGGSFALGARRRRLFDSVVGIEPDVQRARQALALGLVDAIAETVPDSADAILVAGPGNTIAPWVVQLQSHRGIVFDVGSVKAPVIDAVRACCGSLPARYVPCHPIAGKEKSGPAAADGDLFLDQEVILTPQPETEPAACRTVTTWWEALGARVSRLEADVHDEIYAVTSHLPHLIAFAYLQQVTDQHLGHTGGGFRDFSRIGGADPDMWVPIFESNRHALLPALDRLQQDLAEVRRMVEGGDSEGLKRFIARARNRRGSFDDG